MSDHTISALVWIILTMLNGRRTDTVFGKT